MVTALYTGLLAFMLLGLTYRVIFLRFRYKVGLGDGDIPELRRAIRVHGNFVEFVPFVLLIMFLMENNYPGSLIHGFGVLLIAARCVHAFGLSRSDGRTPGRFWGTLLTHALLLVGGGLCVWMFIAGQ